MTEQFRRQCLQFILQPFALHLPLIIAIDINPAQIACLELRVAAYRTLTHPQLLKLIGSMSAMTAEGLQLYSALNSPRRSHLPTPPTQISSKPRNILSTLLE
ncbi:MULTISPECIES: DUF3419 family protein [Spirulina sp. CCY15215]|uniref:DUF3419 family protein n=1 Tax=Spirulina sp. CCY15215 TaxID=2767591 RepID=UPI001951E91B|nr:DUF3419 family protein [Spirulina major]